MLDPDFLKYYSEELAHLRGLGMEFAAEFPKIASRLRLSPFDCEDPYVERLLEGFAFLAARIRKKFDDGFPRFAESILNTVYPLTWSPIPSMAVLRLEPDPTCGQLLKGALVPRGTAFACPTVTDQQTPCEFRTAADITLWPVWVSNVAYLGADLGRYGLPEWAHAALRITLRSPPGINLNALPIDTLPLHVNLPDEQATALIEHLFLDCAGVRARPAGAGADWAWPSLSAPAPGVQPVWLGDDAAMLPLIGRRYRGFRLIAEYFAFPARFKFFALAGLRAALAPVATHEAEVLVLLGRRQADFAKALDAESLLPHCVPAVNVFHKRADRIIVDGSYEFHVVPSRTRPRDFEVYSIEGGEVYDKDNKELFPLVHFYHSRNKASDGCFFDARRTAHTAPPNTFPRSSYQGTDVFISISGRGYAGRMERAAQIGLDLLCTNRDLPLLIDPGGRLTHGEMAAIKSASFAVRPSPPRLPPTQGAATWSAINHYKLSAPVLFARDPSLAVTTLRNLLRLYCPTDNAFGAQQIDGVSGLAARPVTRRLALDSGGVCFARGFEVTVTLDEMAFAGLGCYLFASVLREFFQGFSAVNSFTEVAVRTLQRGEVFRWTT